MAQLAKKAQTTITIPVEVANKLRDAAEQRGVGIAWLANRLVKEGLEQLTPVTGAILISTRDPRAE